MQIQQNESYSKIFPRHVIRGKRIRFYFPNFYALEVEDSLRFEKKCWVAAVPVLGVQLHDNTVMFNSIFCLLMFYIPILDTKRFSSLKKNTFTTLI